MFAARVTDTTTHPPALPGVISGPGASNVLIEGLAAAVEGDSVTCSFPPPPGNTHVSTFKSGSLTVRIGGRAAIRVGDSAACGASVVRGATRVRIG